MSAFSEARSCSVSTAGFEDGLGRRSVSFDREVGGLLECLHVRPELGLFEPLLRSTAAEVAALEDERFARVRGIDRTATGLVVISELIAGERLSDILDRRDDNVSGAGLPAAFGFLLQALPALVRLHAAGITHGAVAPERIIITPNSQVVLLDPIYGAALDKLHLGRRTLWLTLSLMAPGSTGEPRLDERLDVGQVALGALGLALARPIGAHTPAALAPLIEEVTDIAQISFGERFAEGVQQLFASTLPSGASGRAMTSETAAAEAVRLAREIGEDAALTALSDLARYLPPPPPVVFTERPSAAVPPPPIAFTERPIAVVPPPPIVEEPIAAPPPVAAREPEPEPEPIVFAPPAPIVAPLPIPPPAAVARPVPFAPSPVAVTPPVVATPSVSMPPVYAPPPMISTPPPVPPPPAVAAPVIPAPVIPAPVMAPPAFNPPVIAPEFTPVAAPPPAIQFAPPAPPPAPPAAPAPAPALKIKTQAPTGYAPPRAAPAPAPLPGEPAAMRVPFGNRLEAQPAASRLPLKLAAAVILIAVAGAVAGRDYLMGRAEPAPAATEPVVLAKQPVAAAQPTGSLVVNTDPPGAKVLLDGSEVGVTPLTLGSVAAGRHVLTLSTDTVTVRRNVRVEEGKQASVDVPVFSGWIAVFAPIPLDVSKDGKTLGGSDGGRIMLPPGRHVLTFTNTEFGYSGRETVEVVAGQERAVNLDPKGVVNVNAHPWAEVWVDGTRAGETPLANLKVPLGTREFVFRHPQYGERKVVATITMTAAALSVDFTKPGNAP